MGEIEQGLVVAGVAYTSLTNDTNVNRDRVVTNRDGERTDVTSLAISAEVGLTESCALGMGTSYASVRHAFLEGGSAKSVRGLSDFSLGVAYDVLGDTHGKPLAGKLHPTIVSPFLGVRIPYGNDGGEQTHGGHYGPSNSGTGEDLRLSNGTWAPLVGVSAIFFPAAGYGLATHLYAAPELTSNQNGYRPGGSYTASTMGWTQFKRRELTLSTIASLDYLYTEQAERQGVSIINSGGHTVSVTPQLLLEWRPERGHGKELYSLGVQVPIGVYHYRYGSDYYFYEGQLVSRWFTTVSLTVQNDLF